LTIDSVSVEAILLDIGGVFLVPDPVGIIEAFRPYGGTPDVAVVIRAQYRAMAAGGRNRSINEPAWRVYQRELAAGCGISAEHRDEAGQQWFEANQHTNVWTYELPGARQGLARLAKHFRVGIVSNSDGTVERTLAAMGLCQVGPGSGVEVEFVVDSHLVGVAKPDPRIFGLALDHLGVGPDACVYAGDTLGADVAGARNVGIHPFHIDPYGDCHQRDDHDHATDVADLADKLLRPPS
jgi:putative hydrolase of the HAD superfamily